MGNPPQNRVHSREMIGPQEQGMKDALETPEEHNGTGLGYSGYSVKDLEKPLRGHYQITLSQLGLVSL